MRASLGLFIAAAVSAVSGSYLLSPRQTSPYPPAWTERSSACAKITPSSFPTTQCFEAKCSASDLATAENIAQQSCAAAVCPFLRSHRCMKEVFTLTSSIPPATSTATSPATKPSSTSTSSSSSPSPSASTSSNSNSAASNAVNIVGGVAALGLTALML
ncbi:hypothetical protein EDB83DRAFT_2345466 [Lactarius deliciosus]|nr:hypothetical protein EDB83DRAFT_2345466 [Lactarius deliciosus]